MIVFILLYLCFAHATDYCQLRLILNDAGFDGWEDNYVTGTADGSAIDFKPLDSSVSVTNGRATLLEKDIGSFSFQIPAGASVKINYFGDKSQYVQENSWVVELYDIYNPFGSVVLSKSTQVLVDGVLQPTADSTAPVVCGPKPLPVSSLVVRKGDLPYVSSILWTKDPSHDSQTLYVVTYVLTTDPSKILYLGITGQNSFDAILPTAIKINVTVEALNKYGPSTAVTSPGFSAAEYLSRALILRLFDSDGLGWGVNDGAVQVTLNDVSFITATFECATEGGCYSKDVVLDIPNGVQWTLKTKFIRPTKGTEDCSYNLHRQDGALLIESGQDISGPIRPNGEAAIFFDAGCLTADPWGDCVANNGVCGFGQSARRVYASVSDTECAVHVEKQDCTVPCPVACVGQWNDWSSCNPACGVGYKTRNYTVVSPPSDGGADCEKPHGFLDTVQCPNLPVCDQLCAYVLEGYDNEGDGWGGSFVEVNIPDRPTQRLTLPSSSSDGFNDGLKKLYFAAVRGSNVTLNWTAVPTAGQSTQEAAFSVSPVIVDVILKGAVLQNPPQLQISQGPTPITSFVASCVDCSQATPQSCKALGRKQCEFQQYADNVCDVCAEGYISETNPGPGNLACTDVDECAGINPCQIKNANCRNIPGSFICYCTDPDVHTTDLCPAIAETPASLLETGITAKAQYIDTLPPNTYSCPAIITRKEWSEMSALEKTNWINAIKAMYTVYIPQTLENGNNVQMSFWSWTRQLHRLVSGYDNGALSGSQVHGNDLFLPWHRQFLDDVEGYIRTATSTCIFIPMLDTARWRVAGGTAAVHSELFRNDLICSATTNYIINNDNTCALKGFPDCDPTFDTYPECTDTSTTKSKFWRNTGSSATYPGPSEYYTILTLPNYGQFNNQLHSIHGRFHSWVGGFMGRLETAGAVPEFFMHHCFVDGLWSFYQACNGVANADTPSSARVWGGTSASYGYYNPMPRAHSVTPRQVYSVLDLGYRYSYEFLNTLHGDSYSTSSSSGSSSQYCLSSADSTWIDGAPPSTAPSPTSAPSPTAAPTAAPVTLPAWVQLFPPQVKASLWVYDGNGWLWVPKSGQKGDTSAGGYVNPGSYKTYKGSFLESSTHIRAAASTEAPYTSYRGFYKRPDAGTNKTDLYSAHGCHKKRRGGKKKQKESQESKNWKKLRQAYKDEFAKSHDEKLAIEAMQLVECTLSPHNEKLVYTAQQIIDLHMEKACAEGHCNDPCYELTKGKHAEKLAAKYKKKHGKFPKGFVSALNETQGSVPAFFLQLDNEPIVHTHHDQKPLPPPRRLQDRFQQAFLQPSQ